MEHVLVTGAGGFIGANLCDYFLNQGLRVTGIDVHYPQGLPHRDNESYRHTEGDFRNWEAMDGLLDDVDAVVHLASAHLDVSLPTSEYWDINVHSLEPLLELCEKKGVKRFVHVSSVGVYGALTTLPADEDTPLAPQSIYGETKAEGEEVVRRFSERSGFPTAIVRPAWVYGRWCPRTRKLYRALRKRRFMLIGKCNNYRHPVYIKDLLESLRCALESDEAVGQTMIVGGNAAITTEELVASYCKVFGLSPPPIRIPMWAGRLLATSVELAFRVIRKSPPISRRTLEFFDTNNAFRIDKSVQLLGVKPAFDFESGLQDCRDWIVGNA